MGEGTGWQAVDYGVSRHGLRNGFDVGADGREVIPWEMEPSWSHGASGEFRGRHELDRLGADGRRLTRTYRAS